nr:type II toxin-antitoxin system VapC family toxin [Acinetobacter populi]
MLDTNILIYFMKNKPVSVVEQINLLPITDILCMSFVSYAELLKGAYDSQRQEKVLRQLAKLINIIPVEYSDQSLICDYYAKHAIRLKRQGTPIGSNDLWIASHALALGCALVTNNTKEFERIPDLQLQNWV